MASIDAVLPLLADDIPRAQLLARSLARFFPELGTCWVVTPRKDLEAVSAAFPSSPYRVVAEDELIPELRPGSSFFRVASMLGAQGYVGWYVQQLVKLAAADIVSGDFYLTLDSD